MGDEEERKHEVVALDGDDEPTYWLKRAGRFKITYLSEAVQNHTFEGTFDAEGVKQGHGIYTWMKPGEEEGEFVKFAKYEGNYKDNMKTGYGRMEYPNGDVYEGEWFENKIQGHGSMEYKNGDIYSGTWENGKRHGEGKYEFKSDSSILDGIWLNGQITAGKWILKGFAVYEGEFKVGRPFGPGRFSFESGLVQHGIYVEKKSEDEEEPGEEGELKPPNVSWKGDSIVAF